MYTKKTAHKKAIEYARAFLENQVPVRVSLYQSDALQQDRRLATFPDIILADVPYGQMVAWQGGESDGMKGFLDAQKQAMTTRTLLIISSDKAQKVDTQGFVRLEKFQIGKRRLVILRKES